ncbi:TRADD-N-associated membrane domain-containing protein [Streptomyces olivochromogenes]|uniref:Cyanobacterial TRADD-N associated 2 transmembrane domain-containing protein n=1 Tax=Streptomyces olivochromogenes TaxID=1963 RepID=A0A286TT33_STROL|nr:hypothetical protein [Streptomyces olivochromogenes]KUN32835.1 hypothetical protein AQJ27_51260 [Streptomyces olivochromogenes]GAX59026.1 hypothetical protein SO3561_10603 [Streptomyces olivochromogenes]
MAGKVNAGNVLNPLSGGIASEIAVIIGTQVARELGKVAATSLWRIIRQPRVEQRVERVDNIQTVFIAQPKDLAEKRQDFHFDFLNHTLKQSEWTFGLSMAFMSGGALIVLTGAALALVHAGKPDRSYVPIVTSLTGGLLTSGGGALALHWKRTTANLAKAAESNEKKIDNDHNLEVAMTFIDRVEDPQERDRLNSTAALKALGVEAQPETMVNRLLPDPQPKEIESGE